YCYAAWRARYHETLSLAARTIGRAPRFGLPWTSLALNGINARAGPNERRCGDRAMKTFLLRFFTWWNGQTFGTLVWTKLYGEFVGPDEFGNRYYRTRGGKIDPTLGFERRWVIYNGLVEASKVPPNWHGWLLQTVDVPPPLDKTKPHPWE